MKDRNRICADIQKALKQLDRSIAKKKKLDNNQISASTKSKREAEYKVNTDSRFLLALWLDKYLLGATDARTDTKVREQLKSACALRFVWKKCGKLVHKRLTWFDEYKTKY